MLFDRSNTEREDKQGEMESGTDNISTQPPTVEGQTTHLHLCGTHSAPRKWGDVSHCMTGNALSIRSNGQRIA